MIDTHCHLNFLTLQEDLAAVLRNASMAGITQIIVPGTEKDTSASAVEMAAVTPGIFSMVGIHPDHAHDLSVEERRTILGSGDDRTVAIGEVGLDYFRLDEGPVPSEDTIRIQMAAFDESIECAKDRGLPLVIHTRDAFADTYGHLKELAASHPAVIHCFTGSMEEAMLWLDLGCYLSFTGMVTYPKNGYLRDIAAYAPLDRIMVETDAPFLPPQPYRGKRNEPAYVTEVARTIADSRNMTVEEVGRVTSENAVKFFKLDTAWRLG